MRINNINNTNNFKNTNTVVKIADLFIRSQENLSSTRFIQDTATNWVPKAIFSRSKEDFAEMSFLEFLESAIFYFASPVLGEKLFRNNVFKNLIPKNIKNAVNEQIPKTVKDITSNHNLSNDIKQQAIATKAGIVLACTMIPVAEYTLSFAKNLFTLKAFKKSNFNNIANLDKNKNEKENKVQQERVEKSAKKHLIQGTIISALGVGAGILLALYSKKTDKLQNVSKAILNPGEAVLNSIQKHGFDLSEHKKIEKFLKGLSLDFANENGKLALSKGQLALTAILGLFGYSRAAKDRGRLDVLEVWTRVPLVVFYTIFGSELFEKGFINLLKKKNKFPDLISDNKPVLKREELPSLAKELALKNKTTERFELAKLTKQKAFISAVPYAFSLLFMGFTLSAITRLWTQYRYNHLEKNSDDSSESSALIFKNKKPPTAFC